MTIAELAQRVSALEQALAELRAEVARNTAEHRRWWREGAGRFAGDPVFEEIVRLGQQYRESLRPGRKPRTRGSHGHP